MAFLRSIKITRPTANFTVRIVIPWSISFMNYTVRIVILWSIPFNCSYSWTMHCFLNNEVEHVFLIFYFIHIDPKILTSGLKRKTLSPVPVCLIIHVDIFFVQSKQVRWCTCLPFFECMTINIFLNNVAFLLIYQSCWNLLLVPLTCIYSLQLIHSTQTRMGWYKQKRKTETKHPLNVYSNKFPDSFALLKKQRTNTMLV